MNEIVRHPALRYYGGKFRIAKWIAFNFPPHTCYVEPFGGAAGVLLRKAPSPLEVYNDLDRQVVNFFRMLRERPAELIRAIRRTPYSRAEFELSFASPGADPLEEARLYFVQAWQSFGGPRLVKRTGWKRQKRFWESGRCNQVAEWRKATRNLAHVAARFRTVQVERDCGLKVIQRYDTPDTLFYCDPPYPADTRNEKWCHSAYTHEFTAADHLHLINLLNRIEGMAIVSTYPNAQYDDLLAGWERLETTCQTMNKTIATEVLYLSPKTVARQGVDMLE